jgi:hypothetical protein
LLDMPILMINAGQSECCSIEVQGGFSETSIWTPAGDKKKMYIIIPVEEGNTRCFCTSSQLGMTSSLVISSFVEGSNTLTP